MKKIVGLIILFLLAFSLNSFSIDKPHKKPQSAKIERSGKHNAKSGIKPRSKGSRKSMHKPKVKRQSRKISNNMFKL